MGPRWNEVRFYSDARCAKSADVVRWVWGILWCGSWDHFGDWGSDNRHVLADDLHALGPYFCGGYLFGINVKNMRPRLLY